MSTATWWTSRTSPASMTSEVLVRLALLSRWWCTAEVSSSDGIGAHWALESRSESTMNLMPRLMAAETFSQISWMRARSSDSPPSGRYRPRTLRETFSPSSSRMFAILARSSLVITG